MKSIRKLQKTLAAMAVAGYMSFAALGAAEAAPIVELTLQQSIDMALANNRTIKESEEDQSAAYWAHRQARRQAGPTLSWGNTSVLYKAGHQNTDQIHDAMDFKYGLNSDRYFSNTVQVTFPLYTGGQIENNIEAAELGRDAADLTLHNDGDFAAGVRSLTRLLRDRFGA